MLPAITPRIEMRVRNSSAPSCAGGQGDDAENDDDQAEQARLERRVHQAIAAFPGEIERDRDDQEAVRVVVVLAPVANQLDENVPVERGETERDQGKRYHARCASRHTPHIQLLPR